MSGEEFEKYIPQHPLPSELQTMKRDDTVCKFCGVSYLIHNEIKALEDKLKATEKELAFYKGCEAREKKLQVELDQTNVLLDEFKHTVTGKDAVISSLNQEVKDRDNNINCLKSTQKDLEEKLANHVHMSETYRLKLKVLQDNIPDVRKRLLKQRDELCKLKEDIRRRDEDLRYHCKTLQTVVSNVWNRDREELNNLKVQSEESLKERESLIEEKKSWNLERDQFNQKLKGLQGELQKLKSMEEASTSLRTECQGLQKRVTELSADLDKELSKNRNLTMEGKHYQEILRTKAQEIENLVLQHRSKEQMMEDKYNKSQQEIQRREVALETSIRECQQLKQQHQQQQRDEEEIKKRASMSQNQTEEYKVSLRETKAEIEALKKEREAMITSHQNRIEQLRESFKKKMAEMDDWPKKLEDAVKAERDKHNAELKQLEERFKENFVLELQIEKQKHQELLDKYMADAKDDNSQLKSQLSSVSSKHQSEISELHKQIAENKKKAREMEESLRQEIISLKNIIKDLENRLAKLDGSSDGAVSSLKSQLHSAQAQFNEAQQENKTLKQQLATSREEIQFLQDTVRRECEERFELTEALSEAKEQLLSLKKPAGGYTPRNGSVQPSPVPTAPKVPPTRSEEMLIYKRRTSRGSVTSRASNHNESPSPARQDELSPSRDSVVSTNAVNMGFDGEKAKAAGKMRGNNMADSRKRIADAVGRR